MDVDKALLYRFETELNPQALEESAVSASILGYGEISAIFQIDDHPGVAFKRMPLFKDTAAAQKYEQQYREYCEKLGEAGLNIPVDKTVIIEVPGRPVVIYIAQEQLPGDRFVHKRIHTMELADTLKMIAATVREITKVWQFNRSAVGGIELALDGQLSNWVFRETDNGWQLEYVDTSTPLYRKNGREQLDPELLLQSAPGFLRWIIRWLFLDDIMNRYYEPRSVFIDLVANLFKEQRPDLVEPTMEEINRHLPESMDPLEMKEVVKYYREDKIIWSLFLSFRRVDRWIKTKLLRQRYEFILPGKIER
jgi:hypothetical protein